MLVTGGAGAVGRRLVAATRQQGWRVRALVHRRPVPEADQSLSGDLADPASLERAAAGAGAVLHLAAVTHARRDRDYERANVRGTANLLGAAASAGVGRFVLVSTRAVSEQGGGYSRSKLRAEELVRAAPVEHAIVRLPEVYGSGGAEGVDEMIERARRGRPIPVVGSGTDLLCPIHVDDAAAALLAALEAEAAAGKTYTLAGDCISARRVAEECGKAFESRSRIVGVPAPAVAVAARLSRFVPLGPYPDQLQRLRVPKPAASPEAGPDLGFRPRPLAEGLAQIASHPA